MKVSLLTKKILSAALCAALAGSAVAAVPAVSAAADTSVILSQTILQGISLNKTSLTIGKGESFKLISKSDGDATGKRTFTSSDSKVVKIVSTTAGTCTIQGVGTGTATITVKSENNKKASCKVTVKAPAASVTLNKTSATLGVGESYKFTSSVKDGASYQRTFTSSDSTVLKITETTPGTCTAKALKTGTATITVKTFNGKTASCKVTVKKAATSVGINPTSLNLSIGQSYKVTSSVKDGASLYRYFWSTDQSVLSITARTDGTATVKALKAGTCELKVKTFNGKTAACKITVDPGIDAEIKKALKREAAENGGVIKLKVWSDSASTSFEKERIEDFKKKYGDSSFTFDIKTISSASSDPGYKVLDNPKDSADVFKTYSETVSALAENHCIDPVPDAYKNIIVSNNIKEATDYVKNGGKLYGYPYGFSTYFLVYDKRVYSSSQIGTFDSLIDTAGKKNKSMFLSYANAYYSTSFFTAAGMPLKYENGEQTIGLNTNEAFYAAKAMNTYASKIGKGLDAIVGTMGENEYIKNGFTNGTLAAAVTGPWMLPDIKTAIGSQNVGIAKLPTANIKGKQTQLRPLGDVTCFCTNRFTKYPAAAAALSYYLSTPAVQRSRASKYGDISTLKSECSTTVGKVLKTQLPFTDNIGTTVSGMYWASGIGTFCHDIAVRKGNMTDAELRTNLKSIYNQL